MDDTDSDSDDDDDNPESIFASCFNESMKNYKRPKLVQEMIDLALKTTYMVYHCFNGMVCWCKDIVFVRGYCICARILYLCLNDIVIPISLEIHPIWFARC